MTQKRWLPYINAPTNATRLAAWFKSETNNNATSVTYWGTSTVYNSGSADYAVVLGPTIECALYSGGSGSATVEWRADSYSGGCAWFSEAFQTETLKLFDGVAPGEKLQIPLTLAGCAWPTLALDERTLAIGPNDASAYQVRAVDMSGAVPSSIFVDLVSPVNFTLARTDVVLTGGAWNASALNVNTGSNTRNVYAEYSCDLSTAAIGIKVVYTRATNTFSVAFNASPSRPVRWRATFPGTAVEYQND